MGILRELPSAPAFPDFPATAKGLIEAGAKRWGDRDCLVSEHDRVSYTALDERSCTLASRLVAAGVVKGTRVGVLFPNSIPWVLTWAAAARIGAVVVPINTFYRSYELGVVLRHADVQVLIGVGEWGDHDYLARLEEVAPSLAGSSSTSLLAPELPQLRTVLLWGEATRPWTRGGLGRDLATPPDPQLLAVMSAMEDDVVPADVMMTIYTSGSTGDPKGVVHSHGALIRHSCNLATIAELDSSSRAWTNMPLFWVGGFVTTLLRHLQVGGAVVLQDRFEPAATIALLERERVTHALGWLDTMTRIAEHPDFATAMLCVEGGQLLAAIPSARQPRDPGLAVNSLGMSETGGPHSMSTEAETRAGVPERYRGAFGHRIPGVEHRFYDPDTGKDVMPGQDGEVWVRGYNLMVGLYKRERQSVFGPDGWYRTGDRAHVIDDYVFFTGRLTEMIKTAGVNVAPGEVEAELMRFDEVALALVVGVADARRGQNVVAYIVPRSPGAIDEDELRRRLRERLATYKVPRRFFTVAEADLPRLASQKIDRRTLAAQAEGLMAGP